MPTIYPYTVTNSYKGGFFMRTYGRNVRRAWDGDDYRAPKRQRLDGTFKPNAFTSINGNNENVPTYYDLEDNLERAIRETSVAALSSSPSRKNSTIFSLNETHEETEGPSTITPPSSPPPTLQVTPPNIKARKPTFSFMEKKKLKEKEKEKAQSLKRQAEPTASDASVQILRDHSEPLSEIVNSRSRDPSQPSVGHVPDRSQTPKTTVPAKSMTQTVLDFGQSLSPVTCSQCQMSYTPSVSEDAQLHNMYHNRHSQGIELGKPFLKSAMKWCYEVPHIPGSVVVVDRKISLPGRRVVQRVLEVVNKELGSVDISETDLWSQRSLDDEHGEEESAKKVDRYKAFLHVIDGKCVGVCLAERIPKAFRVKKSGAHDPTADDRPSNKEDDVVEEDGANSIPTPTSASANQDSGSSSNSSADLVLESESSPAIVGVSRIWVSQPHRRKGIAVNLLDCVMNQFIYGLGIERDEVAFSQPTEMGVSLARGWFGEEGGWAVYHET